MVVLKVTDHTEFLFNTERWLQEILTEIKKHVKMINPRMLNNQAKYKWKNIATKRMRHKKNLDIKKVIKEVRKMKNLPQFVHTLADIDNSRFIKEYDDIISRMTSNVKWYDEFVELTVNPDSQNENNIVYKFMMELYSLTIYEYNDKLKINIPKFRKRKLTGTDVNIDNGIINYTYPDGYKLTISTYAKFEEKIASMYPIEKSSQETLELIMTYYVQRSQSGSNWSPSKSYVDLDKYYDSGDWMILECFCGIMNNQDKIHGRSITHARLCLDYENVRRCTKDDKFKGSWRINDMDVIKELYQTGKNVLLLVNPVYSEQEIILTAGRLSEIFETFPTSVVSKNSELTLSGEKTGPGQEMRAVLTYPNWPDLYESDKYMSQLRGIRHVKVKQEYGDNVYNASCDIEVKTGVKFTYISLEIERNIPE